MCGASHNALGMENGFVCYSGTKVGSTAMHYCYDCGFSSVQGPLIRTCGQNGLWNGSIPRCECSEYIKYLIYNNNIIRSLSMVEHACLIFVMLRILDSEYFRSLQLLLNFIPYMQIIFQRILHQY